jgi:hypothetical protein
MLQPFELLKEVYLERLIKMHKKYLVSQSYSRGYNHFAETHTKDILVTDYDDLNYARVHFNAVKNDKYASIIHLDNEQHRNKLFEMVKGENYAVYWCIVASAKSLQDRLDKKYTDNVRRYLQNNTTWRISGDSAICPKFEVIFGELFLIIKYGSQVLRVKFEEIEKA